MDAEILKAVRALNDAANQLLTLAEIDDKDLRVITVNHALTFHNSASRSILEIRDGVLNVPSAQNLLFARHAAG